MEMWESYVFQSCVSVIHRRECYCTGPWSQAPRHVQTCSTWILIKCTAPPHVQTCSLHMKLGLSLSGRSALNWNAFFSILVSRLSLYIHSFNLISVVVCDQVFGWSVNSGSHRRRKLNQCWGTGIPVIPCNISNWQRCVSNHAVWEAVKLNGTRREVTPKVCSHSDKEIANAEKMQCPQGPFTGLQSATMSMFSWRKHWVLWQKMDLFIQTFASATSTAT